MAWTIKYDPRTEKELRKIGPRAARQIRDFLRDRIAALNDPRQLGYTLKGPLSQFWRYRVGDYRVLCEIQDAALIVLVVRVADRKEAYDWRP
ncbi:MAG: type II toxin-antitoxin system RelE/ParE family toxin [Nitrospinae bacterium]|nr:type II toxin-antitoxin system RelE/ParE family toxin [Nitrospinota bacterium]